MQRTRFRPLMLGALLSSTIGLTSIYASYPSTYPTQLVPVQQVVQGLTTGPSIPPRVSALVAANQQPVPTQPAAASKYPDEQTSRAEIQRKALYAELNPYVLSVIRAYQGKQYPYLLNNDYAHYNGVTSNIDYQDQLLLRAHPSGNRASHCVGITFEVFFRAMQARNTEMGLDVDNFNRMNYGDLQDFMLLWYAANGPKPVSNPAFAIVKYGLGTQIANLSEAKPGDFVDFSRTNGTGHSVVFLNWIRKNSEIIGLRYWSSQESTGGIGYREEYFSISDGNGNLYGRIMTDNFYIGRVGAIANYR